MADTDDTSPQALTDLLGNFGITYPNAPKPSTALLAFVRGLGLNLAQSEDVRRTGIQQVESRSSDALANLNRSAGRRKENLTGDLIRRGVLSSGESTSKYAKQAEDVAASQGDIARSRTEGVSAVENAYEQAKGTYRQQALERVLSTETDQANRAAASEAQEASWKRQEEASKAAYDQQKKAQDDYLKQMEDLYARYGA